MSILNKAQESITKRKLEEAEKDAAIRRVRDGQAEAAQSRALAFQKLLDLPRAFKVATENGTITVRHKGKIVVEVTFGHDTRSEYESGEYVGECEPFDACWIKYYAEWLPDGAQEYRRCTTKRDDYYPNRDESQNELGEYLLRVMKNEFTFA